MADDQGFINVCYIALYNSLSTNKYNNETGLWTVWSVPKVSRLNQ